MFDPNKVLDNYSDEEREEIMLALFMEARFGRNPAPKTEEEFRAFCEHVIESHKKAQQKKVEAALKKQANIQKAADEKGMTVEEYLEWKKLDNKKKRYARDIKRMRAEIERLKAEIQWKEKFIAKN